MKISPMRKFLPRTLCKPLRGYRERWGLSPILDDLCWQEWQGTYTDFYAANQRAGIGRHVNDSGYKVMSSIDLTGSRVADHIIYYLDQVFAREAVKYWPMQFLPMIDTNLIIHYLYRKTVD